ncbi:NAD(P)H-hydrate epimerase [Allosphingosinicella sp.]|jgi:hydroxyethylthiazole kinase-like uncharacterized protein yjeF|uniref:NAD(P)H-hydrate epimerase n=1 Tax=Allosphingosinicella sp. TaxID=2823234 RepID=UPI002F0F8B57
MTGRVVLTADEMRSAEERAIAGGTSVQTLMERAGTAAAEAIRRYAGRMTTLVLCGPGNNGGDGYVVARLLREWGVPVSVAALGEPATEASRAAQDGWAGEVAGFADAAPAPLLVDALFGTGLKRPLDEAVSRQLASLARAARVRVAIDLPSGAATDDGALLSPVPDFDLTISFQTLKPSHLLQPAARHMGRIVVADIGIDAQSRLTEVGRPRLKAPGPDDHKYRRGYVVVIGSEMPGASALAASAAARAGAGYVALVGGAGDVPNAVVRVPPDGLDKLLADSRIGAIVVGPGLGRDVDAWKRLHEVMQCSHPVIADGDALWLFAEMGLGKDSKPLITTPHAGEFAHMYGDEGNKVEAARSAAERCGHVVVYKGPDTVIAGPKGLAALASGPHWLATAGTGDVVAGIIASRVAAGDAPFEAACAAVWLHNRAAELAGPGLIADDLIRHLPQAVAECL